MSADTSRFAGDPVAARTKWKPARMGANKFRTHDLHQTAPHRIELRPVPKTAKIYKAVGIAGAAILAVFVAVVALRGISGFSAEALLVPVTGVTLLAVGWGMLRLEMVPAVFDAQKGWYWKGPSDPAPTWANRTPKGAVKLADLHALQIIAKTWSGKYDEYTSHELNLILNDGQRINVMDHGDLAALQTQAAAVAALTGKPIWDASDQPVD